MGNTEKVMMERKVNIAMAMEGTRRRKASIRGDHAANLLPFKKGPFHLAVNNKTCMVPVVLYGCNRIAPPGTLLWNQGTFFVVKFRDCCDSDLEKDYKGKGSGASDGRFG